MPGKITTVKQAKEHLRQRYREGVKCPCCTQFVKEYRRTINRGMARALSAMHRLHGLAWFDIGTIKAGVRGGDYAKLAYWGLIEPHPKESGAWRVTDKGARFVRGEIKVPRYAFVLLGTVRSTSKEEISITDVRGFSYDEILTPRTDHEATGR